MVFKCNTKQWPQFISSLQEVKHLQSSGSERVKHITIAHHSTSLVPSKYSNMLFNRVMSIQGFTSKVTIDGEDVPVNPETIFHRIALLKKSDEQLKEFFHYELAPYPLSLFDAFGLRKTPKSVLYDLFTPLNEVTWKEQLLSSMVDFFSTGLCGRMVKHSN